MSVVLRMAIGKLNKQTKTPGFGSFFVGLFKILGLGLVEFTIKIIVGH